MSAHLTALFLSCIAMVEGYHGKPGRHGELGTYQMMPEVVAEVGSADYRGAVKHLHRLEIEFLEHDIEPSPYRLALAWNAGFTGSLHPPAASVDYAKRVVNLYEDCVVLEAANPAVRPSGAGTPGK